MAKKSVKSNKGKKTKQNKIVTNMERSNNIHEIMTSTNLFKNEEIDSKKNPNELNYNSKLLNSISEYSFKNLNNNPEFDKKLRRRIGFTNKRANKSLLRLIDAEKKLENDIKTLSNLKNVCKTCYQKLSKTYQKNKIKEMKQAQKALKKTITPMKQINSNLVQLDFVMNRGAYLPFKDAKIFVNMLMLKSAKEWYQYAIVENRLPANIPKYPHITYGLEYQGEHNKITNKNDKEQWVSTNDWLGIRPLKYRSFKEAREFVRKLKIKSKRDWEMAVKNERLPPDIPSHPEIVYKKNWTSFGDFFKTGKIIEQKRSS